MISIERKKGLTFYSQLETNLNAISRTPKTHRTELERHVHRPQLVPLPFTSKSESTLSSPAMTSLWRVYNSLNIDEDPWVLMMRSDESQKHSHTLFKAVTNGRTLVLLSNRLLLHCDDATQILPRSDPLLTYSCSIHQGGTWSTSG